MSLSKHFLTLLSDSADSYLWAVKMEVTALQKELLMSQKTPYYLVAYVQKV